MADMGRRETGASAQEQQQQAAETGRTPTVPQARRSAEETTAAHGPSAMAARTGVGWMVYAGAVLIVLGLFQAIWGLTALFNLGYFIVASDGLAVPFAYTAWAWIHIAVAALLVITGLAVLAGQTWARYVGIVIAGLAAIGNFLTLAAFPLWSLVMIAVDVLVIYALTVHGNEMKALRQARG
ncbi:hypothetical protein DFJ64_0833 [Thermasporomyces composti]|jgi:hypothetical protein|uniref:DUF7144 domain-containing protein n=2 Tax=Thermasporomyces composti TaxID=696763 RepID=A0A3D9V437_THECX|nr:hypothetical protein DFJ64_0833 [Thermasporomyces composti]